VLQRQPEEGAIRVSASQFLRAHGWKARGYGWEHRRMPDAIHETSAALLQQAQWLADWNRRARELMDQLEEHVCMAGTDEGVRMSILLCEGRNGT